MMQALQHLRDFMDETVKRYLPGNMQACTCILLVVQVKGEDNIHRTMLRVFDDTGTYIGLIEEPEFIPNYKR